MEQLKIQRGVVTDLDRTSYTTTSHNKDGHRRITTHHYTLFKVDEAPVSYRLKPPPPIFEGDEILIVGKQDRGVFHVMSCYNSTTDWLSKPARKSSYLPILIPMIITGFTIIFPLIIYFLGFRPAYAYYREKTEAHKLLMEAIDHLNSEKKV